MYITSLCFITDEESEAWKTQGSFFINERLANGKDMLSLSFLCPRPRCVALLNQSSFLLGPL